MMPSELIALHKEREKIITDTWIAKKGLSVSIKPVMVEENGVVVQHDLDPFGINVKSLGYEEGSITKYGIDYQTIAVFISDNFQFLPISNDIMMEDIRSQGESSNFNEVYCFIEGDLVPKYSIVTFTDYGNVQMRIDDISKKRPLSDIHKYRLVRC